MKKSNGGINIESDVPLPGDRHSPRSKYPWRDMVVGDSFFVANVAAGTMRRGAHQQLGRGNYSVRQVEGGVRIWRIA